MSKIIYIAGPYSNGDVAVNIKKAIDIGMTYNDIGHYAVIPHLTHFMHMIHNREYKYWVELDNRIIPKCDAILRIPGNSPGADKEIELAEKLGIEIL